MMLDPISFSHSHAGGCSQCCDDSCCDRCNQLHDKLNGLFLTHNFQFSMFNVQSSMFNVKRGAGAPIA